MDMKTPENMIHKDNVSVPTSKGESLKHVHSAQRFCAPGRAKVLDPEGVRNTCAGIDITLASINLCDFTVESQRAAGFRPLVPGGVSTSN